MCVPVYEFRTACRFALKLVKLNELFRDHWSEVNRLGVSINGFKSEFTYLSQVWNPIIGLQLSGSDQFDFLAARLDALVE